MLTLKTVTHLETGAAPAAPAVVVLILFFVLHTLLLFGRSIMEPAFGLQNYIELLTPGTYRRILYNTFSVSAVVTIVTQEEVPARPLAVADLLQPELAIQQVGVEGVAG